MFRSLLANTAAMLSGISRHYRRLGRQDVNIVAFAGDGATADCGFQSLSGAAERGERIIYICYDNEGYMNTGAQRSSTTPPGAWTSTTPVEDCGQGKRGSAKDLPLIMVMHRVPYVATANPAYPKDLVDKITRALATKDGLAYIHLYTPCPLGWKYPPSQGIKLCRLAVETGYFPLWEADHGVIKITVEPKDRKDLAQYLRILGKFSHFTQVEETQLRMDVEARHQRLLSLRGVPEVKCR